MKKAGVYLWMILLLFLVGCGSQQRSEPNVYEEPSTEQTEQQPEEPSDHQQSSPVILTVNWQKEETGYAYSTLQSEEEKQLYLEMLHSLQEMEEETELSTLDDTLLQQAFDCVMADHPEIFYADGYKAQIYKHEDRIEKITFAGTYTMKEETAEKRRILIGETVGAWLSGMDLSLDDYGKAKYLYETVIAHTEYDLEASDGQNICSVFINGRSVCMGYAKAYVLLCQQAGIPGVCVSGSVNGAGHAWAAVQLDGEWYHVDPTWGDAAYCLDAQGGARSSYPDVNYDYFCVTTEQIVRSHELSKDLIWPDCRATKNQYYRREGLFLEQPDLEQVEEIVKRAQQQGSKTVTFQCSDDAVYQEIYRLLIQEQKIFDYLLSDRASYADSLKQRTITFWL